MVGNIKIVDTNRWIMRLHNDEKFCSLTTSDRRIVNQVFHITYNKNINMEYFKLIRNELTGKSKKFGWILSEKIRASINIIMNVFYC